MMTRCPRCSATFKLLAEHLRVAHGRVQCGRCDLQFDALENLIDAGQPPDTIHAADASESAAPRLTPIQKPAIATDLTAEEDLFIRPNEPEMEDGQAPALEQLAVETEGDEFDDTGVPPEEGVESPRIPAGEDLPYPLESAPARKKPAFIWTFFSLIFLLLLAGQGVWWQYDEVLKRWPVLRPYVEEVCLRLHCTIQVRRDLSAIHIVSRDIGEHPRFEHALLVKLTFVNQAAFVQPYPVLDLVLFNHAGQVIGQRPFQPPEYLPMGTVIEAGMPPEHSIYAVLELAAPATEEVVSFEFNFF